MSCFGDRSPTRDDVLVGIILDTISCILCCCVPAAKACYQICQNCPAPDCRPSCSLPSCSCTPCFTCCSGSSSETQHLVIAEQPMSTTGAYGSSLPSTEGAAGSSPYATTVQYPTDGVVASAPPPSYDEACSGYAKKI